MTRRSTIRPVPQDLHVVTMISNPVRYESRYILFEEFRKHMENAERVKFHVVEVAFGDRPFMIDPSPKTNVIQLRHWHELWIKENALNIGISRLPDDWQYCMWADADIEFMRPDFATEIIHQLQGRMIVQCFQDAIDLGPDMQFVQRHQGFVFGYEQAGFKFPNARYSRTPYHQYGSYAHPGYAWAARREAIDGIGGLIDWAVLGSSDAHMAYGLVHEIDKSYPPNTPERYKKKLHVWQERCKQVIKKDIGSVPGTIIHYWHGRKSQRGYADRFRDGIVKYKFDPDRDLKRDSQGIWQFTDANIGFRDFCKRYFRSRNEDGNEL